MKFYKYLKEEKLSEVLSIVLIAFAILLIFSIYSFDPSDPPTTAGVNNTSSYSYNNYMGVIGAYLSHYIFLIFGKSSYILPFIFILWGIYEYKEKTIKEHTLVKILGIICLIFAVCGSFGLPDSVGDFSPDSFVPRNLIDTGGIFGYLFTFLIPYVGYFIYVILASTYLLSLVLITSISFNKFIKYTWVYSEITFKFLYKNLKFISVKAYEYAVAFSIWIYKNISKFCKEKYLILKNHLIEYNDKRTINKAEKRINKTNEISDVNEFKKEQIKLLNEKEQEQQVLEETNIEHENIEEKPDSLKDSPLSRDKQGFETPVVEEKFFASNRENNNETQEFLNNEDTENESDESEAGEEVPKLTETEGSPFKTQIEQIRKETVRKKVEKAKRNIPYELPPLALLSRPKIVNYGPDDGEIQETITKLEYTFEAFKIDAKVTKYNVGPTVTMYEVLPAPGVPVKKIVSRADDIKLRLAAKSIRIVAPIPGKTAVGIEIPNSQPAIVTLREIMETETFQGSNKPLKVVIGKDILGRAIVANLAKMPHMLIAGATGSGKSVCVNSIIISLLMTKKPDELKLILIDPKMVELKPYKDIPHLMSAVVTDMKKAARALQWSLEEMEERYKKLAAANARDIETYNSSAEPEEKLPYLVIIVDELADLMALARKECEGAISRLAAMARAVGIHVILATQRPSVDVVTGLIKANFPSRLAFQVASGVDSKTIIGGIGAENLLGNGDMLYKPQWLPKPIRVQGAFLSDKEIEKIIEFITNQETFEEEENVLIEEVLTDDVDAENDEFLPEAEKVVVLSGQGSVAMLQRYLKVGHRRAVRLMETLEEKGIVGPSLGPKPREVYVNKDEYLKIKNISPEDEAMFS